MSETMDGSGDGRDAPVRRPGLLTVLAVALFFECAILTVASCYLMFELLTEVPESYGGAIGILVLSALAAVWLGVIAVNTLRGRAWIRGAAVVWQVLQLAVALGSFQGLFARQDIGWLLTIPALVVLVLVFTRPVIAATTRGDG